MAFGAFSLVEGATYRVVQEFKDHSGIVHPVGETFRYLSKNFFPYDAGLTLFIEMDGKERTIRLQDYPEEQGPIVDGFSKYVEFVGKDG